MVKVPAKLDGVRVCGFLQSGYGNGKITAQNGFGGYATKNQDEKTHSQRSFVLFWMKGEKQQ